MNEILIIARKELLSVVRERRVLFTTLVLPILIMPLLMFGPILLFGNAARQTQESVQKWGWWGFRRWYWRNSAKPGSSPSR